MKRLTILITMLMAISGCGNDKPDLEKLKAINACIDCDLAGVNLRKAYHRNADFIGTNLTEANLSKADLWSADFSRADLSGAKST